MGKYWTRGRTATGIVLLLATLTFTARGLAADEPKKPQAPKPQTYETKKDKVSYALGVETGRTFKRQGIEVDPDILFKGIKDALAGNKLSMSDDELLLTLNSMAAELKEKKDQNIQLAALDNKKAEEKFLAANKTKEGVVTLADGLQYKVLKAGEGKKPTETDTVEVNYSGRLIDGKEFFKTGNGPQTLKLSDHLHVIPGLREALKLMPAGSKWQIFLPHTLGYGQRGVGQVIGPNSALIYEVELVAIK